MSNGIPIAKIIDRIYYNFYSEADWQIIKDEIASDKKAA